MPIVEPAPWRHQYFAHVPCPDDVHIPADDPEAWAWNPEHQWVFDKLRVAQSQDLVTGPHGLAPPSYPVFSKPIYNFGGLGLGSRVLASREDYLRYNTPGHFWMPLLAGQHVSTDAAVVEGALKWVRHATGAPTHEGMFDHWAVHASDDAALDAALAGWVRKHLATYTGMLNVETIGGVIIEAHLRFADQWPDLYGAGWVEALVGLYRDHVWSFDDSQRRDGYSVALFMPHGSRYRHPPPPLIDTVRALPGVSSVQITFYEDKAPEAHAMPPGGFRVALINAFDLEAGWRGRTLLEAWFSS